MRYYAFTTPGLEDVTIREIGSCFPDARSHRAHVGVVRFETDAEPRALLRLGTTEDVFAFVAAGRVSGAWPGCRQAARLVARSAFLHEAIRAAHALKSRRVRRITFRVISQRSRGRHAYRRVDMERAIAGALQRAFPRWKEVPDDAHLEVWIRQEDLDILCGVRLSDRTMRHRRYQVGHIAASLRPIIARSMVLLSEPSEEDVFLDPMCGAGTILLERRYQGRYGALLGGDIRSRALAVAASNLARCWATSLIRWDAARLPLRDGTVSRIVCNLPFGEKIGSHRENLRLYGAFLREAERVLARPARMVLLTSEESLLREKIDERDDLTLAGTHRIVVLGKRATVFEIHVPA